MFYRMIILIFISLFYQSGCSSSHSINSYPRERPIGKGIATYRSPKKPTLSSRGYKEATGSISLAQALSLALMYNPELRSFSWEVRAREARVLQASLYSNPEISADVENFAGSGKVRGLNSTEITIWLSQSIQLGGKVSKRRRVALLESRLAGWNYEAKRIDVLSRTGKAFIDLLAQQESVKLLKQLVQLNKIVLKTITHFVQGGRVSPIEITRSKLDLSFIQMELQRMKRNLRIAKSNLAATWGSPSPNFTRAAGNLKRIRNIPPPQELIERISQNPDLSRWAIEMERRKAKIILEKAKGIPNLMIRGGVRHFNGTGDNGFVLGIAIPIPLFDRNQGGKLEAKYRLSKAKEDKEQVKILILTALSRAYQILKRNAQDLEILRKRILPASKKTFNDTRLAYQYGKLDYLRLLDAQQIYFRARRQYIDSLRAYHKAVIDVERLIGERLDRLKYPYPNETSEVQP